MGKLRISDITKAAERNTDYEIVLKSLFKEVKPIYTGFMGRIIYKCE